MITVIRDGNTIELTGDDEATYLAALADDPAQTRQAQIAELWREADQLALQIADHNSRARFIGWLIDPTTPAAAKALITQVQAALDGVWSQYAAAKATVEAGQTPDPITLPESWPSFWDIAQAANP